MQGGNLASAFADGAILFPLIAALAMTTGMNGALLMASAGVAYILAGLFFRIPMPVQPLKSIVVGAVALGASAGEVRIAALCLGLFCLALIPLHKLERHVPRHLIHGIQFSLGVLLLLKGLQWTWGEGSIAVIALMAFLIPSTIFIQSRLTLPVLGIIAVLSMALGFLPGEVPDPPPAPETGISPGIILSLLLPQLALTLTNSVAGTHDAALRYFGKNASRASIKNLLLFIGVGNIAAASGSGLPFCHGSGGMTAHVHAGAKTYAMNLYIGFFLVGLAAASLAFGTDLVPRYPVLLMAALVSITGWHHMRLAEASWKKADLRLIILAMGTVVLLSQNMLYGLVLGIALEGARRRKWLGRDSA